MSQQSTRLDEGSRRPKLPNSVMLAVSGLCLLLTLPCLGFLELSYVFDGRGSLPRLVWLVGVLVVIAGAWGAWRFRQGIRAQASAWAALLGVPLWVLGVPLVVTLVTPLLWEIECKHMENNTACLVLLGEDRGELPCEFSLEVCQRVPGDEGCSTALGQLPQRCEGQRGPICELWWEKSARLLCEEDEDGTGCSHYIDHCDPTVHRSARVTE